MPDIFDQISSGSSKTDIFDQVASEKSQKKNAPITAKGAAGSYAAGVAGGFAGAIPNLANLITQGIQPTQFTQEGSTPRENPKFYQSPMMGGKVSAKKDLFHLPGSREFKEKAEKKIGVEPSNALERILSHAGEFGGQEAELGALGGPVGMGVGLAHGSASGALYGYLLEKGVPEGWALGITAIASASPIAARRLAPKLTSLFKKGVPFDKALQKSGMPKKDVKSIQDLIQQPHKTIEMQMIGEEALPKSSFEVAERAIENIKPVTAGKPLEIEAKIAGTEGKPLKGRVTPEPKLGAIVSHESFHSEASGGRQSSDNLKAEMKKERKPIEQAYKESRAVTENHNAIYPELAKKTEELIARLEEVQLKNAGQDAVYKHAVNIRNMVGTPEGLIQQNAARLIAQSDAMSQLANYELQYTGYKGLIKGLVHDINKAVIESLKASGKDASKVVGADKLYSRWADKYLSDELTPFLEKKINNPEALFRKAVSDEGTYRALKNALAKTKPKMIDQLDRALVEKRMGQYYKKPDLVGSEEYVKDLRNLKELIGKKKAADIDHFLRKRKLPTIKAKAKAEGKTALDRFAKKIAEYNDLKPDDVLKKLNSRSGIRELRKELKKKDFDELTKRKMQSILREGHVEKKFTGDDLYNVLNKENNYEIFSEILGAEETEAGRLAAKKLGKNLATAEKIKNILIPVVGLKFLYKIISIAL